MKKFNYIIFHKKCLDGFSGFVIAYYSGMLKKNIIIKEDIPSTNSVPKNIKDKDIIIIDVAYKKNILKTIFKYARSVVFIDHHFSNKKDIKHLKNKNKNKNILIIHNTKNCGATLTWKYFFNGTKIPLFLKYIEDQDTGRWLYKNTKPFTYALRTYYNLSTDKDNLKKWIKLINKNNIKEIIKNGFIIQKYIDHLIYINYKKFTLKKFPSNEIYLLAPEVFKKPGNFVVAIYNGFGSPSVTDISNYTLKKINCDFCLFWVLNIEKKRYIISMRSKETNVAKIAKVFNGGGHKLAAAFSLPSSKYHIEKFFSNELIFK